MTGKYDFEERTTEFAKSVIRMCKTVKYDSISDQLFKQVVRFAGSIGANYREANDALGTKDFLYRLRICRKEAKETLHWLSLIEVACPGLSMELSKIKRENQELLWILNSMITKSQQKITQ